MVFSFHVYDKTEKGGDRAIPETGKKMILSPSIYTWEMSNPIVKGSAHRKMQ